MLTSFMKWIFPLHFYQMGVAAAIGGAAVVGAAASSSAAGKAADAQRDAANQASSLTERQFDQTRRDQAPFREIGYDAQNELANLLGLDRPETENVFDGRAYLAANPDVAADAGYSRDPYLHYLNHGKFEGRSGGFDKFRAEQLAGNANKGALLRSFSMADFQKDPGYEFRQAEGMKGLTNSATARGGLLSGAALKAASRYNQDFASNEYGNAFNRDQVNKTNTFNRLASLSGSGQTATNQVGVQGANMAQQVGNNIMGAGNARASGYIGQANAINGAIGTGFNMYQQNQLMNRLGGASTGMDPSWASWGKMNDSW